MSHVYCPECGFQNPESANFCARCGAALVSEQPSDATQTFSRDELEDTGAGLEAVHPEGPALVVRSGGGRSGEVFKPAGETTMIGRSPECDVFLDDVTVSRKHALLVRGSDGGYTIEDQGSLNGTFLNRRRIDSARLASGDELQIGKYRLTFLEP
ncbi:MAG TPA: FHA domain-containing protein [Gaiellaceae bacterium]|nr:FHA domain-containing protein [Gaiellaceae bacterium]